MKDTVAGPARVLLEQFAHLLDERRLTDHIDFYVASLSLHDDDLAQWRAYTGNESGYALGFETSTRPRPDDPNARAGLSLFECTYDDAKFGGAVRTRLRESADVFERYLRRADNDELRARLLRTGVVALGSALGSEILRHKHRAFEPEREWRLVVMLQKTEHDGVVRFRQSRLGLTPFVPIDLEREGQIGHLKLASVVVGPGENSSHAARSAQMILDSGGYRTAIEVRNSTIPYRRTH